MKVCLPAHPQRYHTGPIACLCLLHIPALWQVLVTGAHPRCWGPHQSTLYNFSTCVKPILVSKGRTWHTKGTSPELWKSRAPALDSLWYMPRGCRWCDGSDCLGSMRSWAWSLQVKCCGVCGSETSEKVAGGSDGIPCCWNIACPLRKN